MQNTGGWPWDICSRGVGRNSIQCTNCQKWMHKKCSAIKHCTVKVSKSFLCRYRIDWLAGTPSPISIVVWNADDGANVKVMDTFCYLGDMLNIDGHHDAAVKARKQNWRKNIGTTNKEISLLMRGKLYRNCVSKVLCYMLLILGHEEREHVVTLTGWDENNYGLK